jgi:cellulose synthase/poly-beta-1,6-N-acetylglucosamine synthase-like glycosyltransferase
MLAVVNYENLIVEPVREMLIKIVSYLPTLLGALIILTVGWVVAKTLKGMVDRVLKVTHFDRLAEKAGISQILTKGGLKTSAREVLSTLVYWLVIIMVLVMVVNALGLPQASDVLASLFAYIPNVIAALFVLVVGMFLANFVSGIVRTAAGNTSLPNPEVFAGVSRWAIIVFAGTISLKELGIATLLVTTTFNIVLGGVCLALALAFGLGGREAAARYLEKLKRKHSEKKPMEKVGSLN